MKSEFAGYVQYVVITCAVGIGYSFLGQHLYPLFTEVLWSPIGVALYFLLFAVVILVTMLILNRLRHKGVSSQGNSSMQRNAYQNAGICLLVIFLAAGLFEYLYELGGGQPEAPSSYVFLIDDSGSMIDNDPTQRRVDAINEIMSKQPADFPYAVYGFTEDAKLIKSMGPRKKKESLEFNSSGNTNLLESLNTVLKDLSDGSLEGGASPRILLLSDGESYDTGWRELAQDCQKNNIVVSCIGFGIDSDLLRNIAARTGGVFIQVDNISSLTEEMEKAITTNANRDLLSSRPTAGIDLLYAFLRVLFLCLLGLVWSHMKFEAFCSTSAEKNRKVFVVSFVLCAVSSVLFEVLLQRFWVDPILARMFLCVMWALTIGSIAGESLEFKSSSRVLEDE